MVCGRIYTGIDKIAAGDESKSQFWQSTIIGLAKSGGDHIKESTNWGTISLRKCDFCSSYINTPILLIVVGRLATKPTT